MRPSFLLAAIPFAFGCAQQSAIRVPAEPTDEPLQVRLFAPTGGALNYELSEPAYVAIFAIRRGDGISMIYPHFRSQIDFRSKAGFNQQPAHPFGAGWSHSVGAGYDSRVLLGQADAYYVIASKYPLPVEGILHSPWALRSLVGADRFRATDLSDIWYALEEMLVEGLPDDAWASDVYLNWRDPFLTFASAPRPFLQYCEDGTSYIAMSLLDSGRCYNSRRRVSTTPVIPGVEGRRRDPPKKPFDRDPFVPLPPDADIERMSRFGDAMIRGERVRRDAESSRAAIGRASDRSSDRMSDRASERGQERRSEPVRPAPAARGQPSAPAPSRPAESSPPRQPAPDSRPQPKPDN